MKLTGFTHDHSELRALIARADEALAELVEAQLEGPPPTRGQHEEERHRTYDLHKVHLAWSGFRGHLLAHLDQEEQVLPELQRRVERGRADVSQILTSLRTLCEQHEHVHNAAIHLRCTARAIPPLSGVMASVAAAFLRHAEEEDLRTFPLLTRYAGVELMATSARRYGRDARICRDLRAHLRPPEPESRIEPARASLLQRLWSALAA